MKKPFSVLLNNDRLTKHRLNLIAEAMLYENWTEFIGYYRDRRQKKRNHRLAFIVAFRDYGTPESFYKRLKYVDLSSIKSFYNADYDKLHNDTKTLINELTELTKDLTDLDLQKICYSIREK